jgi:hypothetical protein
LIPASTLLATGWGSIVTLTGAAKTTGGIARLQSIAVLDKVKQSQSFDILFFNASPTVASADNAAIDIVVAEMAKCVGKVTIATTDYVALATPSLAFKADVNVWMKAAAGSQDLFALLVCRSGTPTYGASSLVFQFTFEQVA